MIENFSLSKLFYVVLYAVAVGISIKILAIVWRYLWNIETGPRESGALAGAVIVLLAAWGIARGPRVASISAALIILGYFLLKLIKKYIG
jgi:hypothetical protein